MSLHANLYRAARIANNVNALTHPKRLGRRAKNVALGRALRPFWKVLWR